MSNRSGKPGKQGRTAFHLETLEKRILFSADIPFPVVELSSHNTTGHIGLVSATESSAQSSTSSANSEQHSQLAVEIVIIDSATPDYRSIVADLEQQDNSPVHVYILDADRDGIDQISAVLGHYNNVDALHLISHGSEAQLSLGNATVDFTELLVRADDIAAWQDSFTAEADFLIYGCDLASTDTGRSFVSTLGNLTGTDVAASDDLTGSALLGGDWELEYTIGSVESNLALSDALQHSWAGVLSATVDTSSSGSTSGSTLTISHTTSGTDRLMIVGVSLSPKNGESVSSVTYNGSNLTLVGVIEETAGKARVELWQMVAPATGTHDVTVTFNAVVPEGATAGVMTFNGVDQTTPLGSFVSAEDKTGIASVNVSTEVGDLVFSTVAASSDSLVNLSEASGQSEYWDLFQSMVEGAGSTKVATSTSETMSWTFPTNEWAIGGVAIKASTTPVASIDGYHTNLNTTLNVDWWNTNWSARQNLTFNNSAQTENLTDFPILVVLNSGNIDYSKTQDNGADLRFIDADGTILAHEIETWNESGDSYVWVKIPLVD
ncbi:MAG: DUF2341 domain-containing protein, partial [Granulosicoccus sp.]|nr:DUF2341 domain-containing protein [Granulosicoccus sp.]